MHQQAHTKTGIFFELAKVRRFIILLEGSAFMRGSALLFVGVVIASVLNYVFHVAIGRMVNAEVYGEIESLISLSAIVSVPAATVGMVAARYGAVMKVNHDYSGAQTLFRYLQRNIFMYGSAFLVPAFLATPFFREFLNISRAFPLVLVWVFAFFSLLSAVTVGFLSGWQKFESVNRSAVWGNALKLVVGVGLVAIGFGTGGAIFGFMLGSIGGYVVSLVAFRSAITLLRRKESNMPLTPRVIERVPLKRYVGLVFIGNLALALLGNADMVFAKHYLDGSVAGEYGVLFVASRTIFFVTSVVASVLFSISAGENHKYGNASRIFRQGLWLTVSLCAVALTIFAFFPSLVLGILFHRPFLSLSGFLVWFGLSASLYSLVNLVLQYLLSIHRIKAVPWLFAIALLEVVLLSVYALQVQILLVVVIGTQLLALGTLLLFARERKQG